MGPRSRREKETAVRSGMDGRGPFRIDGFGMSRFGRFHARVGVVQLAWRMRRHPFAIVQNTATGSTIVRHPCGAVQKLDSTKSPIRVRGALDDDDDNADRRPRANNPEADGNSQRLG
jgi:hypothetical protein